MDMYDGLFPFFFYLSQIKILAESAALLGGVDVKQVILLTAPQKAKISDTRIQQPNRLFPVYVRRKTVNGKLLI